MKKILILTIILCLTFCQNAFATDKLSKEYLQNHSHSSIMKSLTESFVKRNIKSALKKETGANFDVNFSGYSVSSMKKGIFKYLELSGKNVKADEIIIPYVHLKSLTDYNYVEYNKDPIIFKSDMIFAYDVELSEDTMNEALKHSEYQKVINSV